MENVVRKIMFLKQIAEQHGFMDLLDLTINCGLPKLEKMKHKD